MTFGLDVAARLRRLGQRTTQRSIEERTDVFLGDEALEPEDVRLFIERLLEAANSASSQSSRQIVAMVAAAGVFELISHQQLTEIEIFGVKLQQFSYLLLAIPPIIGFLFLRATAFMNTSILYSSVYYAITAKRYPSWDRSDFDMLLVSLVGMAGDIGNDRFIKGWFGRLVYNVAGLFEGVAIGGIAVSFVIHAFDTLYAKPAFSSVEVSVSLLVTILFIVVGGMSLYFVHPNTSRK